MHVGVDTVLDPERIIILDTGWRYITDLAVRKRVNYWTLSEATEWMTHLHPDVTRYILVNESFLGGGVFRYGVDAPDQWWKIGSLEGLI